VFTRLTDKLPASATNSEILREFNEWAIYTNITLVPGSDSQAPRSVADVHPWGGARFSR